jgi:hypothetical protein
MAPTSFPVRLGKLISLSGQVSRNKGRDHISSNGFQRSFLDSVWIGKGSKKSYIVASNIPGAGCLRNPSTRPHFLPPLNEAES